MRIAIVGSGYVGLVTGACLADFGHDVVCVDIDQEKIKKLNLGMIPIFEPGLEDLVKKNVSIGRLSFTADLKEAMVAAKAVFIAVGTPESRRGEGYADMKYVYGVAEQIAPLIKDYLVIINKSTVPVKTAERVKEIIEEINPKANFSVVSNPEFLREGAALKDFSHPDRIVVGIDSEQAKEVMQEIYGVLNTVEVPIVYTSLRSAETVKLASNAFLAVKISFSNEMADFCEKLGADAIAVLAAMGMDNRIGKKFLHPGPGWGGSCFPKDTKSLEKLGHEAGVHLTIVEAAIKSNSGRKARMVSKIVDAMGGNVSGKRIACLGLTFKPDTDDMRESPALVILPTLAEKGAKIVVYDPKGMEEAKKHMDGNIKYATSTYEACEDADCLVIMTEWNDFRGIDLAKVKGLMKGDVIVDLRNIFYKERGRIRELGFQYTGIGVAE